MAKPTADTDKELMQQLKNLKAEILDRVNELKKRGYIVKWAPRTDAIFCIAIVKTVEVREEI